MNGIHFVGLLFIVTIASGIGADWDNPESQTVDEMLSSGEVFEYSQSPTIEPDPSSSANAESGICPNYYGPYTPNPIGQPAYCENMMHPGTYGIQWAHGPEIDWDWQYLGKLDMMADTRYVLTYDSRGELSIDEYQDSSLNGDTLICCSNNGPDELVFCLEWIGKAGQDELNPIRNFNRLGSGGVKMEASMTYQFLD
jgi:hypothetical protein